MVDWSSELADRFTFAWFLSEAPVINILVERGTPYAIRVILDSPFSKFHSQPTGCVLTHHRTQWCVKTHPTAPCTQCLIGFGTTATTGEFRRIGKVQHV